VNPKRPHRIVAALLAAAVATAAALAGAELVLLDGQVVRGDSVRREGDIYVLTMPSGEFTIPVDLVEQVRLTSPPPAADPTRPDWVGDGPTGVKAGPPVQLAGPQVPLPPPSAQQAVFGKPAEFKKASIDPTWTPTPAWDPNVDVLAESRSTWKKASIDPTWTPKSAYDPNVDVLAESRSTWQDSPMDSTWTPTDGFKKSSW
jgi:hypothetical protein